MLLSTRSPIQIFSIRCGIASSAAALLRTANKTITRWRCWIPQMRLAAEEHLPLRRALSSTPFLFPDCWDSPSFAENLWWASQGNFDNPVLVPAGHEIMQKYRSPETCKYLQKKYYSIFLDSIHDPESRIQLDISLMRRVINMFDPFEIDFSNKVDISACFEALLAIGVADRTKVIKTWLHGWATSHRIKGDSLFNCLFGPILFVTEWYAVRVERFQPDQYQCVLSCNFAKFECVQVSL